MKFVLFSTGFVSRQFISKFRLSWWILLGLCIGNMVTFSAYGAAAKSSGSSAPGWIPVRFSISAGFHSSSMKFEADRKNDTLNYFGLGGDFNVPIPVIHFLIGVTGWIVPSGTSGESAKSTILVVGPYLGYTGEQNDIFIGPAVGTIYTDLRDSAAAPDSEVRLDTGIGCGFGGWRHYFGKGITTGFGINAYHCSANSYNKDVISTGFVETKSTVSANATSTGGFVYFLVGWNETRQLF